GGGLRVERHDAARRGRPPDDPPARRVRRGDAVPGCRAPHDEPVLRAPGRFRALHPRRRRHLSAAVLGRLRRDRQRDSDVAGLRDRRRAAAQRGARQRAGHRRRVLRVVRVHHRRPGLPARAVPGRGYPVDVLRRAGRAVHAFAARAAARTGRRRRVLPDHRDRRARARLPATRPGTCAGRGRRRRLSGAMSRWLVSAAHRSSGKTTVSIGLCAALRRRGLKVQPFKKGPDYIDPMWLGLAAGRPCRNLDPYLSDPDELEASFMRHAARADASLVEGNLGLHDGMAADGSDSNAALARRLGLPVVLVLDTRGTARGIAPLVLGYQAFDPGLRIAGVVLNRVGGTRHGSRLRDAIERYTGVRVLGAIAEDPRLAIVERHLGLVPSNEADEATRVVATIADAVSAGVDVDALLAAVAPRGADDEPGR